MSGMSGSDVAYGVAPEGGGRAGGSSGGGFRGRGSYGGGGNPGRDRRPGGRGGGHRDGDWVCPNTSCGNLNFAKRVECNKCGTPKPAGSGQSGSYNSGVGAASNYGNNTGYGRGSAYTASGYEGNSYGGEFAAARGTPDEIINIPGTGNAPGVDRGSQIAVTGQQWGGAYGGQEDSSRYAEGTNYDAQSGGNYGSTKGSGGRGFESYGVEKSLGFSDARVDYGRNDTRPANHHGVLDAPTVKQCDQNCGDTCDNSRIYVSGLPLDVTTDELRDLFGGIGQVARIKQKRGYKDQWPWNIKIYTDEAGKNKGDAVLSYEDPCAAHSAGGFFNDYSLRGHTIKVSMAEKYAPRPNTGPDQRSGGDRGGGYGGDRSYGGGGPDRRYGGGHRSRPY